MHWLIVLLCNFIFAAGTFHFIIIVVELVYYLFINNSKSREVFSCDNDCANVIVLIPVCNEDSAILSETLKRCLYLDGHPSILVIENSSVIELKDNNIDVCSDLDIDCLSIPHLGNKAMALNYYLKNSCGYEYVAILDVDQQPEKIFVATLLPFFRKNEKLAVVQLPQVFRNKNSCFVSYIYSCMQEVYYKCISVARGGLNLSPFFGTNCVIRYDVLREIGFFDEKCLIEDVATSFNIHLKGYGIKYYYKPIVSGIAPKSIKALMIQIKRYVIGGNQLLFRIIKDTLLGKYDTCHFFVLSNYFHQSFSLILNGFVFCVSLFCWFFSVKVFLLYINIFLVCIFVFLCFYYIRSLRFVWGVVAFFILMPFFFLLGLDVRGYSYNFNVTPK